MRLATDNRTDTGDDRHLRKPMCQVGGSSRWRFSLAGRRRGQEGGVMRVEHEKRADADRQRPQFVGGQRVLSEGRNDSC